MPTTFSLSQNYPNPFNPTTTIEYSLPDKPLSAQVTLKVFNLGGQLVRTLVNTSQTTGAYSIEWDGTDLDGKPVSSGLYIYRLSYGKISLGRKNYDQAITLESYISVLSFVRSFENAKKIT